MNESIKAVTSDGSAKTLSTEDLFHEIIVSYLAGRMLQLTALELAEIKKQQGLLADGVRRPATGRKWETRAKRVQSAGAGNA